jgi:hypothetical protein
MFIRSRKWHGRMRCRCEENFKGTGCENVDWIHLAQDRVQWLVLVITVMNLRVSQQAWNLLAI